MRRSGVTLLEVVFSIGIVTVGLLGVLATLVVAGKQNRDGAVSDAGDRVGRNAIREFEVRGFNRARGARGTWAAVPADGRWYCLDPIYVAANGTGAPGSWFPALDPLVVPGARMQRVSVRAWPGDQVSSPQGPVGSTLASAWFQSGDDLVFGLPADRTLAPVQVPGAGYESRASEGLFSWFATLQCGRWGGDNALLYIVVCHRRDVADPGAERVCDVERIDGAALKLAARPGRPDSDLEVVEGRWVMLAGQPANTPWTFAWHRVLDVSDVLPAGVPDFDGVVSGVATRWVTASGRDWTVPASGTQVVVMDSVVAVYEKTVKMQE